MKKWMVFLTRPRLRSFLWMARRRKASSRFRQERPLRCCEQAAGPVSSLGSQAEQPEAARSRWAAALAEVDGAKRDDNDLPVRRLAATPPLLLRVLKTKKPSLDTKLFCGRTRRCAAQVALNACGPEKCVVILTASQLQAGRKPWLVRCLSWDLPNMLQPRSSSETAAIS